MSAGLENEQRLLAIHPSEQTFSSPSHHSSSSTSEEIRQQVFAVLNNANDKLLREVICHCQNLIDTRPNNNIDINLLRNQFRVVPNILSEYTEIETIDRTTATNSAGTLLLSPSSIPPEAPSLLERLKEEVQTLGLSEKAGSPGRRKVASQWLIKEPQKTNLPSDGLDKYQAISELCAFLSSQTGNHGFNSCIVNYYADGSARTRPHSDDESYIDQDCPIVCFSLGASREIGLFDKSNGNLIGKHSLDEGSIFVMDSGAQSNTKHQILPAHGHQESERYSISFRKIKYMEVRNEWPFTSKENPKPSNVTRNVTKTETKTTLILGTSIPYYLDFAKLSGSNGRTKVVNLCKRGAKICTLQNVLDDHYRSEGSDENVDKIIISVGTNDIRNNKKNTVGHLYTPMENLVRRIKSYYPRAMIYIQSLLPQRVQNAFTVSNVLGFNKLLVKISSLNKCYYLDIFSEFLGENNHPHPNLYRWDGVHLSNKGLSVLARAYISKIRGRFNPVVHI